MRVSTDTDRQNTHLQKDALLKAGVDHRHIYEDKMSGVIKNRPALLEALEFVKKVMF